MSTHQIWPALLSRYLCPSSGTAHTPGRTLALVLLPPKPMPRRLARPPPKRKSPIKCPRPAWKKRHPFQQQQQTIRSEQKWKKLAKPRYWHWHDKLRSDETGCKHLCLSSPAKTATLLKCDPCLKLISSPSHELWVETSPTCREDLFFGSSSFSRLANRSTCE